MESKERKNTLKTPRLYPDGSAEAKLLEILRNRDYTNMKVGYFSFPYSRNPKETTKQIKKIVRKIKEIHPNIVALIPHLVWDELYDLPLGYTHTEIGIEEIEIISRCDFFAYDPQNLSAGVRWEYCIAKWLGIPIVTYDELLKPELKPILNVDLHEIDTGLQHLWLVKKTLHPTMAIFQIRKEHVPTVYAQMKDAVDHNIGYRLLIRNMRAWIALIKHDYRAIYAPPYEVKIGFSSTKKSMLSGYDWRKGYGSGSRGRWNSIELGLPVSDINTLIEYAKKVNEIGVKFDE